MSDRLRALVLGSAAGGGYPQWNCRCPICVLAWNNDSRVLRRTQSSIAVSGADGAWMLFNASPDLRQQILSLDVLQPRDGMRHTPIRGVFVTNGDVDHIAGLLTLREQQPFHLYGSGQTLKVLSDSPVFGVVNQAVVARVPVDLDAPLRTEVGVTITAFAVPGKVPLFMEGAKVEVGAEAETTVGLEIVGHGKRMLYIPGCAKLTPALLARIEGADALLFDGTTYTDDEMVTLGLSPKTASRMGHLQIGGPTGSLQAFAGTKIRRRIYIHINNTNPILVDGSPEREAVEAAGWEVAYDGMEITLTSAPASETPKTPEELEAALRHIGATRYHNLHRFHRRLHDGKCSFDEVKAWALNRYYYQSSIPIKDATVLTRFDDPAFRREWRKRIEDHDGHEDGVGGIEKWLRLTDSLGLSREYVTSTKGILPATRFAVEAYINFCRTRTPLEAVASSLTELFSPNIIGERVSGMLAHYPFVSRDTLAYFTARPAQAGRDSDFALQYCKDHARTPAEQRAVLEALEFKCSVLWLQLDGLWTAYVDGAVSPGAWRPEPAERAA